MSQIKSIDLLDLAIVFAKNKVKYLGIVIGITILGLVIALLWPKKYTSHLTFIANQGNSLNLSSGGLLGSLANLSVSTAELSTEQILIILRSDDLLDLVIEDFNLAEVYGSEIYESLRITLNNAIKIEDYREGGFGITSVIATKISIEDKDPNRAFAMLNYYYTKADSIVLDKNRSNLKNSFQLLSNRFEKNKLELRAAEDSLNTFQKKFGIIELEEQSKLMIQNIASLQAQIIQLELQINIAKELFGETNNQVKELDIQLNESKRKYDQLVYSSKSPEAEFEIQKPLEDIPDLSIKYLRLFRELQVQQELYKVLYPQYEQQKLNYEEIKTGLMLIDDPDIPTYKSSPKRAYIVIASFLFANFLAILIVLIRSWKKYVEENDSETKFKLDTLANEFNLFK